MATIGSNYLTLVDVAKRQDPDGSISGIAQLLAQSNDLIADIPWVECNNGTNHTMTIQTSLPSVGFRQLNAGATASKQTTAQVVESTGLLEAQAIVDAALLDNKKNAAQIRLSEATAFIEAMKQKWLNTFIYGDTSTTPEGFLGLAPRYSTISGATNAQNIIDAGGSGSDNTSVWLLGLGTDKVFGIYPEGTKMGLEVNPDASGQFITDSNSKYYKAYMDQYVWRGGLAIKDWRYAVRIANIDVSNMVGESSAADLPKSLYKALTRFDMEGCKPVFVMNRTTRYNLGIQGLNKSTNAVKVEEALDQFGRVTQQMSFLGVPVRTCDQITLAESRVV